MTLHFNLDYSWFDLMVKIYSCHSHKKKALSLNTPLVVCVCVLSNIAEMRILWKRLDRQKRYEKVGVTPIQEKVTKSIM